MVALVAEDVLEIMRLEKCSAPVLTGHSGMRAACSIVEKMLGDVSGCLGGTLLPAEDVVDLEMNCWSMSEMKRLGLHSQVFPLRNLDLACVMMQFVLARVMATYMSRLSSSMA